MLKEPPRPPVWIHQTEQLLKVCAELHGQPRIAVDTESNSLFAYQEKVCLIQISSPTEDYLIDPLEIKNLSPIGDLFQNERQEKIFHASEYDLICLKRDYNFSFSNIFDTMIAARILGHTHVGLDSLLDKYFGITLNKKYQRANWGMRPLPLEMLDYARLDTHYLFALRDALEVELHAKGLLELAREDFSSACNARAQNNGNHVCDCWKVAGAKPLNGQDAAILNQLCKYRDAQAQKADLPLFKVFSNELLYQISKAKPACQADLNAIPHCSEKIIRHHGSNFLKAVAAGLESPPLYRPRNTKPDEEFLERIDLLKNWRKTKAKEQQVESDVVLPKDLLEHIATANPKKLPDLERIMRNSPVRFEKYGKTIMTVLSKKEKT